jgi:hypothetical protein
MRGARECKAKLNRLTVDALRHPREAADGETIDSVSREDNVSRLNARMNAGCILALGLISATAACSSGSNDTTDSGSGSSSSSSGGGSSSGGSSSGGSSSGGSSSGSPGGGSSSSGSGGGSSSGTVAEAGVDAGSNITVLFPFNTLSSGTDVAAWPGDSYCIGQTGITSGATGNDGGVEAGDAGDAAPGTVAGCGTETYLQGVSTVTYDPTAGDTLAAGDEGSLKIVIPFTGYNQQADFQHVFALPQSLAGQILFVRFRLDSGFNPNPTYPGGFYLAVKTSNPGFTYASTIYNNITAPNPTGWTEYDLDVSNPAFVDTTNPVAYDPTSVVAIELHFDTGGGPAGGVDAGALPSTATFHIDTIGYFPNPNP